jgi:DNA-directed RNA polymerase subunit beta
LEYVSYRICELRQSEDYCICDGTTHAGSLDVTVRFCEEGEMREEAIHFGEFALMGKRSYFVINGVGRVVVSQLHRSPGICFEEIVHASGKVLHAFQIIPDRGPWLEVQFDPNDLLSAYLDRWRRTFVLTTLLQACGDSSDREILGLFYRIENKPGASFRTDASLASYILVDDFVDAKEGIVLVRAHGSFSKGLLQAFAAAEIEDLDVVNVSFRGGLLVRTLKKDPANNTEDALREIAKRLRLGEPVMANNAAGLTSRLPLEWKR